MSGAREWIRGKLASPGFSTVNVGTNGLIVYRNNLPDAHLYCVGVGPGEVFDADALDSVICAVPNVQFIVVLPTGQIGHSAYRRAEERGICVEGFGELKSALDDDADVAKHIDSQERYERRRLERHPAVESLKRQGQRAYEVRRYGLKPLTVVTTNVYEFTADELYSLLDSYAGIDPELIVVTNPNCKGLSTESKTASRQAGIGLIIFPQFLDELGDRWK